MAVQGAVGYPVRRIFNRAPQDQRAGSAVGTEQLAATLASAQGLPSAAPGVVLKMLCSLRPGFRSSGSPLPAGGTATPAENAPAGNASGNAVDALLAAVDLTCAVISGGCTL